MSETQTIMDRLRTETRPEHDAIENIPNNIALANGTLPLERYHEMMFCYQEIHEALEGVLDEATHPALKTVWGPILPKRDLIQEDLDFLKTQGAPSETGALQQAQKFAASIREKASTAPLSLLGILYVLEGSTLGGAFLQKSIRGAYNFEENQGMKYYCPYDNKPAQPWKAFKERMTGVIQEQADCDLVVETAIWTFREMGHCMAQLSVGMNIPTQENSQQQVTT